MFKPLKLSCPRRVDRVHPVPGHARSWSPVYAGAPALAVVLHSAVALAAAPSTSPYTNPQAQQQPAQQQPAQPQANQPANQGQPPSAQDYGLAHPDPEQRIAGLHSIVQGQVMALSPSVEQMAVSDPAANVRVQAVYALGQLDAQRFQPTISRAAAQDPDASVRLAGHEVLRAHGLATPEADLEPADEAPTPAATPVEPEPVEPEAGGRLKRKARPAGYRRVGGLFAVGAGVRMCIRAMCEPKANDFVSIRGGGTFELGMAYRFVPFVSIGAEGHFAIQRTTRGADLQEFEDDLDTTLRTMSWGAVFMARAHPIAKPIRIDPSIGVGFGINWDLSYADSQARLDSNEPGYAVLQSINHRRWLIRTELAVDVFLTDNFTLSPNIQLDIPFAGRACGKTEYKYDGLTTGGEKICYSVDQYYDRAFERQLPLWLSFGVAAGLHF